MDDLRKKTDKELAKMEKKLAEIYRTANKELNQKWNAYMEQAKKDLAPFEKAYQDAKDSGDKEKIQKAKEKLEEEKKIQTVQNKRYKAMTEETAHRLSNVNQMALDYVNGKMPEIYTLNYNGTMTEINTDMGKIGIGKSFALVDEHTVRELAKKDTTLFPQKVIDRAKDEKWNLKAINSQVLQGILQGESIPQIQERLQNVTSMNSAAATRNARTMCTTAENNGRMSSIKEAEEQGIVYEKQWMATHDERTRASHAELDGESVPIDEEFSNHLQFPGDPNGDPEEVYNCRCSMVRKLIGFRREDGSVSEVGDIKRYDPHYFPKAEPEQAKEAAQTESAESRVDKWGFHGNGGLEPEKADQKLRLAGIDDMDGKIKADIRASGDDQYRVKLEDGEREVVLKVNDKQKEIYIDWIYVENAGQGEGTRLFTEIKTQAEKQGYEKLTAYAAGDAKGDSGYNGYYSLAKFGFDGHIPEALSSEAKELFEAETIQDLMKTEKGRKWWKENGTGFEAELNLKKKRK